MSTDISTDIFKRYKKVNTWGQRIQKSGPPPDYKRKDMRASEFLRKLTDLIATVEGEDGIGSSEEVQSDETSTFVPPLQQDIELKKKEVGVESIYDQEKGPEDDRSEENRKALVGGN